MESPRALKPGCRPAWGPVLLSLARGMAARGGWIYSLKRLRLLLESLHAGLMSAPFSSQLGLQTLEARLDHGLLWTCWGLNTQCFPQANTLCAVRVDIECFLGGSSRGTVTPKSSTKDRLPSKGGHPLTQHTAWRGTREHSEGRRGPPAS